MAIYNLGSINIDYVYRLKALPRPGETVTAHELSTGLGGKGANQSIAVGRGGGAIHHIGAIGRDSDWTLEILGAANVNLDHVVSLDMPSGHAVINVDDEAENAIVLFAGANRQISPGQIENALSKASKGDWLLLQNETNGGVEAAKRAKAMGLNVVYCAAPFSKKAIEEILPFTDLLAVNEIEAAEIRAELPDAEARLREIALLVTKGAQGADYVAGGDVISVSAFKVKAIDTTGAGDTFLGYFLAGIDSGLDISDALKRASAASAMQVTRKGAATAIPLLDEVLAFQERQA